MNTMPAPPVPSSPAARRLSLEAAAHLGVAVAALAAAGWGARRLGLESVAGLWVSLSLFGVIAVTVTATVAAYHPFPRFGAANAATTARAALTALLAGLVVTPHAEGFGWSLAGLAGLALALDGVDGWLARRQGLSSAFGARYDMEVDAVLILLLAFAAAAAHKAGPWVLASGLIRYLFVAAGWAWPSLAAPLPPSLRRKAVCVIQTAALGLLLLPPVVPPVSTAIAAAALAALTWSFAVDLGWLVRRARALPASAAA